MHANHSQKPPYVPKDDSSSDKFDMSFAVHQVKDAFDTIKSYLFASDSPIFSWKITDIKHHCFMQSKSGRTYVGAQITLYLYPDVVEKKDYSKPLITKIRSFVSQLEQLLKENQIQAGVIPDSDLRIPGFTYTSYRSEKADKLAFNARHPNPKDRIRIQAFLKEQPLFKALK